MTILKTRQFLIEYFYLNITEFSNKLRLANDFLLFNKRFFACNIPDEFLNSSQINHYPYLFQNYCSNYWIMKILPNQSRTSHSIYFTHRTRRARVHVHMHTYAHTHTTHDCYTLHWQSVYWNVGIVHFVFWTTDLSLSRWSLAWSLFCLLYARDNDGVFFFISFLLCALSSALRTKEGKQNGKKIIVKNRFQKNLTRWCVNKIENLIENRFLLEIIWKRSIELEKFQSYFFFFFPNLNY